MKIKNRFLQIHFQLNILRWLLRACLRDCPLPSGRLLSMSLCQSWLLNLLHRRDHLLLVLRLLANAILQLHEDGFPLLGWLLPRQVLADAGSAHLGVLGGAVHSSGPVGWCTNA